MSATCCRTSVVLQSCLNLQCSAMTRRCNLLPVYNQAACFAWGGWDRALQQKQGAKSQEHPYQEKRTSYPKLSVVILPECCNLQCNDEQVQVAAVAANVVVCQPCLSALLPSGLTPLFCCPIKSHQRLSCACTVPCEHAGVPASCHAFLHLHLLCPLVIVTSAALSAMGVLSFCLALLLCLPVG